MPTICKIRPWQFEEAETLALLANNTNISKYLSYSFPNPYTIDDAIAFITKANMPLIKALLCIEVGGNPVGGIGLHAQHDIMCKNMELGYWLGEAYWGKGIMNDAIRQMVAYGFQNFDITRIFARTFGTNIGSQRVLEKAGFVLEARFKDSFYKFDKFEDELVYAIRR